MEFLRRCGSGYRQGRESECDGMPEDTLALCRRRESPGPAEEQIHDSGAA